MITLNQALQRMSPETLVSFLGDIVEMSPYDVVDANIISAIAHELISNVGEDALMMLSEAGIEHPEIDREFEEWAREMESHP